MTQHNDDNGKLGLGPGHFL